jgi:undecaprenyl-diphosphatase
MPVVLAILLGIVEGLTEYLPVSSTGHLILAGHLLGLSDNDPAISAFEIVVQLGAILAVVAHYRELLANRAAGLLRRDPASVRLALALAIAFFPAAVAGLLFRKAIKSHLFGPLPVAAALVLGGIAMIVIERGLRRRRLPADEGLEQVSLRRALVIGLGQCFSLWPGMSRAMCTILAGELAGLTTSTSAEFSFLLAIPTLGAATLYEAYKSRELLASGVGTGSLVVGLLVSFGVAWAVIASFLRYLRKRGLEPFGWYRIAVGILAFWLLARP